MFWLVRNTFPAPAALVCLTHSVPHWPWQATVSSLPAKTFSQHDRPQHVSGRCYRWVPWQATVSSAESRKGPYPTCNLDGLAHMIIACQPISEFKHSARSQWDKDYLHSISRALEDKRSSDANSHAQKEAKPFERHGRPQHDSQYDLNGSCRGCNYCEAGVVW